MRAAYWTIDTNWGAGALSAIAPQHRAAFAPGLVERLRAACGIEDDGIASIGKILQLDPVHVPGYCDVTLEMTDGELLVTLGECDALHDDPRSPLGLLTATPESPGFEHMAQAVNPRARVEPVARPGAGVRAWRVWIDPAAEPVPPHPLARLVNSNDITTFDLTARPKTPVTISPGRVRADGAPSGPGQRRS